MEPLFQPLQLKGLRLKNRLMHVPTTLNMSDPAGHVTEQCAGAYESIARGGVGSVTVGATCVRWDGLINERMLGIYDDTYVIGLRQLVDVIHFNDAAAGIQLFYGGLIPGLGATHPLPPGEGWIPGTVAWGPSNKVPIGNNEPGVLTTADYEALVEAYAQGARRAKEAGFDYLSFHFCHGSLPHTNLSLLSNVDRTDRYADRFLFLEEILQRTQALCGKDFPLIPRLCCDENLEGGYDIAYFAEHYAPRLHALGIAALDCTFGSMLRAKSRRADIASSEFIGGNFYTPKVVNGDNIRTLKQLLKDKGIDLPLVGSCNLSTPAELRTMAYDAGADMVGVCRLSLDDPDFANKMAAGRDDEVCCPTHTGASLLSGNIFGKGVAGSPQNPAFGHDREYRIRPAAVSRKVVVVGGGSGGLEYARVAHLSGHRVVLFERAATLGGTMDWAGNYPHLRNSGQLRHEPLYRSRQVALLGIDCRLGTAADAAAVLAERPDVVVLATGARAQLPEVPGLPQARASGFALTMDEVMARTAPRDPGQSVLVWGAAEGVELALELARQGRRVRLIESAAQFVPVHYLASRAPHVLRWLAEAEVAIETGIEVQRFEAGQAAVRCADGTVHSIACDHVIVCQGRASDHGLQAALAGQVATLHTVGDIRRPRSYGNALHEAAYLARQI
ncbi:MAG: FAD-dependent oxidoreductase [Burkholderiales bacterium]